MATFVLVHGAWGGAHGFGKVRRLLQSAGHEVFTPSLTGIGERAHLASPQVCLTTHIADVANAVLYEDLRGIVLLGFSYGGLVITGALEHIADRVRHLVYLDAFVPADGESLDTITGGAGRAAAIGPGAGWLVPPQPRDFDDPAEGAWSAARRTAHPAGCFSEPVRLARPLEDYPFTRTYIKASAEPRTGPAGPFWAAADRARNSPAWRYREVATTHMVASNRPGDLASLLTELAATDPRPASPGGHAGQEQGHARGHRPAAQRLSPGREADPHRQEQGHARGHRPAAQQLSPGREADPHRQEQGHARGHRPAAQRLSPGREAGPHRQE